MSDGTSSSTSGGSAVTGSAPEYGVSQFPGVRQVDPGERKRVREEYGWLRAYYKLHPRKYVDLQRWLNQARMGVSYDVYLARSAYYTVAAVLFGALAGVLFTLVLSEVGVIAEFRNPLNYRGDVTRYLGANRSLFAGAAAAIVGSALFGALVWYARYFYPRSVADRRRRNIDVTLPHAITFMYALSYGGMSLLEVMKVLGDAEDTYGEVANEFETITRDVELFGNDLNSALRNARNLTPSNNFEQFLDDMLAVLEAGGSLTTFFETEADSYLGEARDEQERFLETLALFSEFFIVGFVATPLFVIVILMVISLIGGQTLQQMTALVYLMLPLGMAGFLVLLDTLSEPYRTPKVRFDDAQLSGWALFSSVVRGGFADLLAWFGSWFGEDDPELTLQQRIESYRQHRRERDFLDHLENPLRVVRRRPLLSLLVSVPLAVVLTAGVVLADVATLSPAAFVETPVETTTALVVMPLLVIMLPLSLFYELRARRDHRIARRFPDTLNVLSSANKMGIEFSDGLSLVSRWSRGPIADELRLVRNDIRWNFDTRAALLSFADRLGVPQLSRTIKLIAEGTRSTSDLARVLSVAAEDTRARFKIDRRRRDELSSYIAVVIIGFLVYLLVIVVLDTSYLDPIANTPEPTAPDGRSVPFSVGSLPVQTYKAVFFHSALIQAVGVGILAGKLANDTVWSGLKYSIALVALTLITFTFV